MPAPTFVAEYEGNAWDTTTPKTSSVTVATNDILVIGVITADNSTTAGAPTGGSGISYTSRATSNTGSKTKIYLYTADIASGQSYTLSVARTAGSGAFGFTAARISGHGGFGQAATDVKVSTSAPSIAQTCSANSMIVNYWGDWDATDASSRTWLTINSITPTAGNGRELVYFRDAAQYTLGVGYWEDVGGAGSKTSGLSAPNMEWTVGAVEILAGSAAATSLAIPRRRQMGALLQL